MADKTRKQMKNPPFGKAKGGAAKKMGKRPYPRPVKPKKK